MRKSFFPYILPCAAILVSTLLMGSCFWVKAKYNPIGLQYAVTVQTEAPLLMGKATESFYLCKKEVYQLMSTVEEAYENAKILTKNQAITGIWDILRNPDGNRLGKFMKMWEKEGKLDKKTVALYIKWVNDDLKTLVEKEKKKGKK